MIETIAMTEVACALCGAAEAEPVYERHHETGSRLGRLPVRLVLCPACGFLYTSPRPTAEELAAYYREAANSSGRTFRQAAPGSAHARLLADRAELLTPHLEALRGDGEPPLRLLDVGCGRGAFLATLPAEGLRRVGLEPAPEAARAARARGLEVVEARLEANDLPPESFDVLTCISTLEHAFEPMAFLADLRRLIRPGGLVFLEVPDSTRPIEQVAEFFSFEHLSHFTSATLHHALELAGFEPVATARCARVSALRCIARRTGRPNGSTRAPAPSPLEAARRAGEIRRTVGEYRERRRAFEQGLVTRIGPRIDAWRTGGARVAIFGAGVHTHFLLGLFDLGQSLVAILDSDPSKEGTRFLRWDVRTPARLAELELDAVLVSSKAYQDEMLAAIRPPAAELGIEVLGCYE